VNRFYTLPLSHSHRGEQAISSQKRSGMDKFQFSNLSQDQKQDVVDELVQQMQWLFDLEEESL